MPAGNEPDVFFVCTRQFKFQEKLEAFLVAFQELNLELNQTWYFVCTRKFKLISWAFPEGLLLQVLEPSPLGQGSNLDQVLKLWNQHTNLSWTRHDKLEYFCTDGLRDLTQIWNWYATRSVARNATRNASSFSWNLNCLVHTKNTSGSFPAGILTRLDWALYC